MPFLIIQQTNKKQQSINSPGPSSFQTQHIAIDLLDDLSTTETDVLLDFFTAGSQNPGSDPEPRARAVISHEIPSGARPVLLTNFYRYNHWVRIRDDIFDPFTRTNIGGWIGRIVDFYNDGEQDVFYVQWSADSLKRFPEQNILKLIKKRISPMGTYIACDQILPIRHDEAFLEIEKIGFELLSPQFKKKFPDEFDLVYGASGIEIDQFQHIIWEKHFAQLASPTAEILLVRSKSTCRLAGFAGSDDKQGVWVEAEYGQKSFVAPLIDFKVLAAPYTWVKLIKFYKYWAAFFCRQ